MKKEAKGGVEVEILENKILSFSLGGSAAAVVVVVKKMWDDMLFTKLSPCVSRVVVK